MEPAPNSPVDVPRWVDTHCHLFLAKEPAEVLVGRAVAAGVDWVMVPGTHLVGSQQARDIVSSLPGRALWSAGLHPHDAIHWPNQQGRITALALEADAIGECGLDYYRDLSPREAQRDAFADQLALASSLAKPVIVHCRDALLDGRAKVDSSVRRIGCHVFVCRSSYLCHRGDPASRCRHGPARAYVGRNRYSLPDASPESAPFE
jgi:Tat protein secretion system quality control protein TatD with DNase activity